MRHLHEHFEELWKELFARAIKLQEMVQDLEVNSGIVLAFLESSQLPRTQRKSQQHALQNPVSPREVALE